MGVNYVDAFLSGQVRKIEPDKFTDKETGVMQYMTRLKVLTGSLETDDEVIHDINVMHGPAGPDGPKCIQGLVKGKFYLMPVRIKPVFNGRGVEVQGAKDAHANMPSVEVPQGKVISPNSGAAPSSGAATSKVA